MKKITEALTDINQEVGLEVNTEKTKYLLMSVYQNAGHNHNIMSRDSVTRSGLMFGFIVLLNSVAFSPQANYTDRATAACRRS
jgi:hypothetical protein